MLSVVAVALEFASFGALFYVGFVVVEYSIKHLKEEKSKKISNK